MNRTARVAVDRGDGTAIVPLTKSSTAVVDASDAERVSQHSWYLCDTGCAKARIAGRCIRMHHFLLGAPPPGYEIDHINRDPLDNRRENLRHATSSQQKRNRSCGSRVKASRYKGVFPSAAKGRWFARIKVAESMMYLGSFGDDAEAARAYDKAAREHFGEFACLNFPDASP